MTIKDYFSVLGLGTEAGEVEVKKAYRSLARKWHPDKNSAVGAEERFKEIVAAYDYLLSADRREKLQRDLKRQKEETAKPSPPPPPRNQPKTEPSPTSKQEPASPPCQPGAKTQTSGKKTYHWSQSFRQKEKPHKPEKSAPRRSFMEEEEEIRAETTHSSQKMPFSFAFSSFFDQVGAEFDTFLGAPFDFSVFFGESPSFGPLGGNANISPPRAREPPQHPRHVAPETGDLGGLDKEYLFSTPQQSRRKGAWGSSATFSGDDGNQGLSCSFCHKMFTTKTSRANHESGCSARTFSFDTDRDDPWAGMTEEDLDEMFRPHKSSGGDWRQQHADLLEKIRRDRRAAHRGHQDGFLGNSDRQQCSLCGDWVSVTEYGQHVRLCVLLAKMQAGPARPSGSIPTPGSSRWSRAKEYSKTVPKPGQKQQETSASNEEPAGVPPNFSTSNQSFSSNHSDQGAPRPSPAFTKSPRSQPATKMASGANHTKKGVPTFFQPRSATRPSSKGSGRFPAKPAKKTSSGGC